MRCFKLSETHNIFHSLFLYILTLRNQSAYVLRTDAPEHFRYTSQGAEPQIPGTDDLSDLDRTRSAFTILGRVITKTHTHMHFYLCEGNH